MSIKLDKLIPWINGAERKNLPPTQLLFYDVLPWLQKLPTDFDTILDVGCGTGFMSAFFYARGHKVVACDPWDRFQFKDIIEYHKATPEFFKGKKFDAILLSHVLEHIPDAKTFMDEIKNLLNDNGYLFILVPVSLKVECGHWWQGWSLPQLGMHLAAHSFDCSKGIFQLCGNYSACGYGRLQKNIKFDINFDVNNLLEILPKKFKELIIDEGGNYDEGHKYSLLTNALYIDENKIEITDFKFTTLQNYIDTINYKNDIINNLNNEIKKYNENNVKYNTINSIIKKKIYPKWFVHFLCWFIPSSKNRKNLKKYIKSF